MNTIVINKKEEEKNVPKIKYKFSSFEAITLYATVYFTLFLICKIISHNLINITFYVWYPIIVPFFTTLFFSILFMTKFILSKIGNFFLKYLIFIETITIFRMWYGTYSMINLKNNGGEFVNDDVVAICFLILQIVVIGLGLLFIKMRASKSLDL